MATETATVRVGIYRSSNTATVAGWSRTGLWCKTPVGIEGKSTIFERRSRLPLPWRIRGQRAPISRRSVAPTVALCRRRDMGDRGDVTQRQTHPRGLRRPLQPRARPYDRRRQRHTTPVLRSTEHGATGTWEAIITIAGGPTPGRRCKSHSPSVTSGLHPTAEDGPSPRSTATTHPYVVALNNPYMMAVPGAPATTGPILRNRATSGGRPATEVFHHQPVRHFHSWANTFGIFFLPQIGSRLELHRLLPQTGAGLLVGGSVRRKRHGLHRQRRLGHVEVPHDARRRHRAMTGVRRVLDNAARRAPRRLRHTSARWTLVRHLTDTT